MSWIKKLFLWLYWFYNFEQHEVIFWVLLTIYIHHLSFNFQTSNFKPTLRYHLNCFHSIYIRRINYYKVERQAENTNLLFVLWNIAKDICCTHKSLFSFCLELIKRRTQSALSLLQDFEHNCFLYWIIYLNSWSLAGVSLLSNCLLSIWSFTIGSVELFEVKK